MKVLDLKYEAFGLDVNDLSLKIVKLEKKRRGFVLTSFNEEKIAPGIIEDGVIKDEAALARIIKYACATVKGKKLNTKYVIASLPEEKSFLQVIQMPKMNEEELNLAVPLEAENYIPMPISEVYLDFQVISPVKDYFNHSEVLIVAMPQKIVDSYISCFKKAGLIPIILEAESEAIAMALVKRETNSSLLILIDFGENNTDFIVFSGHSIRFTCSIPISSQMLTKAISESLKISLAEAEKLKIEYGLTGKKSSRPQTTAEEVSQIIAPIKIGLAEAEKLKTEYDLSGETSAEAEEVSQIIAPIKIGLAEAEKLKIEYGLTEVKTGDKAEKVSQIISPILEDLIVQIKKYLNFYRDHSSYEYLLPDGRIEKILLCGGGAKLKGLVDFMSKKLETPVELGDPLTNFLPKEPKNSQRTPINKDLISFTTAIGLALRPINNKL